MKAVAYGRMDQDGLAASLAGLSAIGYDIEFLDGQVFELFHPEVSDLAIMEGARSRNKLIIESYRARSKTPLICVEYGYIRRTCNTENHQTGHWQVSIGRLGWAPPDPCPDDRLKALGVGVSPWRSESDDKPILVCGDHPGSPAMGKDFLLSEIEAWASDVASTLRRYTKRRIFWRPHPALARGVVGFDGFSTGTIKFGEFHAAVCHKSNTGNEALFAGCPVITDGDAAYADICSNDLAEIETPKLPDRDEYFARVAYAQWTLEEIRSGLPFRFYKDRSYI